MSSAESGWLPLGEDSDKLLGREKQTRKINKFVVNVIV